MMEVNEKAKVAGESRKIRIETKIVVPF